MPVLDDYPGFRRTLFLLGRVGEGLYAVYHILAAGVGANRIHRLNELFDGYEVLVQVVYVLR